MTNRIKIRRTVKQHFIYLHLELFRQLEKEMLIHPEKFTAGKVRHSMEVKIINNARNKIGYSEKTSGCDIMNGLFCMYRKLMSEQRSFRVETRTNILCRPIPYNPIQSCRIPESICKKCFKKICNCR